MSSGDVWELVTLWLSMPIAFMVIVFWFSSALYVYIDACPRSKSRLFAALLAVAVAWSYWPASFLVYLVVTIKLDQRSRGRGPLDPVECGAPSL